MAAWARVLKAVPNSKIYFKNNYISDPGTQKMIRDCFSGHGISDECLILEEYSPSKEFLDKYNEVDISLDTFPYGGGVTSAESLLMGVPVLTGHGDRWMCRATSSYLKVIGRPELITYSLDDYVTKAANLRAKILNSEINAKNMVKHLEVALKDMYREKSNDRIKPRGNS
jgi:predicted O-linked N-acetylglucosamine transferase (SPINDLY family)